MENQERRFLKQLKRQESLHKVQMEALLSAVAKTNIVASTSLQGATPSFVQFKPSSEHWTYYWARFCTFVSAHSVSNNQRIPWTRPCVLASFAQSTTKQF